MLKTVLIGAGGIAWKHCEALRKLGVELSGIYDVNPVNAGRLAEAFGCPVVSDPVHAIAGADMVHILTPPSKRWELSLIHISEPTRRDGASRMPSSA